MTMAFDATVKTYLRVYQSEYNTALHSGQHTAELSFRVPMHNLFTQLARDLNPGGNYNVILEPRNQGRMGRPDWRIQDSVSFGVYGYIEGILEITKVKILLLVNGLMNVLHFYHLFK